MTDPPGPEVQIHCLGPVRATVGDATITMAALQQVTLATLVAVGPQGTSKGRFYSQLFDGRLHRSGEQTAAMRVHRLQKKLQSEGLNGRAFVTGSRIGINLDCCRVDVWEMADKFDSPDINDVVVGILMWAEPFDGVREDPQAVQLAREQLRHHYRQALIRASRELSHTGLDRVLAALLAEVADDPYDEGLAASAAIALYRLGRQAEALETVARCRRVLARDLGLTAGPELGEVELAILRHDFPEVEAARVPVGLARPDPVAVERFVGRRALVESLTRTVAELPLSRDRSRGFHLVEGTAGVGKSSVLELVAATIESSTTVRLAHTEPNATDPFGMLVRLLPELDEEFARIASKPTGRDRTEVWARTLGFLSQMAATAPLVLMAEDMHWADDNTIAFLRFLASAARPAQLLLVLTARANEPGPNPPTNPAWTALVSELEANGDLHRHRLEPFTVDELRTLVELDHPQTHPRARESFVQKLFELTGGLPLVASVLSRDAEPTLDTALLAQQATPEDQFVEHLRSRVSDDDLDRLLGSAALFGQEFRPDLLAEVTTMSRTDVDRLLDQAHALNVCVPFADGERWRFDHLLTTNYFAGRLGFLRPILFARIAEMAPADDPNMLHYVMGAGAELDDAVAVERLREAAEQLGARFAFGEAAVATEQILERLDPADHRAGSRSELHTRLAAYLCRAGDLDRARQQRRVAFDLAANQADGHGAITAMMEAAIAGLPAGEHAGGDRDRLEMLLAIDARSVPPAQAAAYHRWLLRQARLCGDGDTMELAVDRIDPRWEHDHPESWRALQLERLAYLATHRAEPVLDEIVKLAAPAPSGPFRAEAYQRAAVCALMEQRFTDFDEVRRLAVAETEHYGSARGRWSLDLLDSALSSVGFDGYSATPELVRRSGIRWSIPDAFEAWSVQMFLTCWLNDSLDTIAPAVGQITAQADDDEPGTLVPWQAAAALVAAHDDRSDEAIEIGAAVGATIAKQPAGLWTPTAAALLAEVASRTDSRPLAEIAHVLLEPQSGRDLVLGLGVAHLGPVDRYLGLAAETLNPGQGASLLASAAEQAARSGASQWLRVCSAHLQR